MEKPVAVVSSPSPPLDFESEMRKSESASVEEYWAAAEWLRVNGCPDMEFRLQMFYLGIDILRELRGKK